MGKRAVAILAALSLTWSIPTPSQSATTGSDGLDLLSDLKITQTQGKSLSITLDGQNVPLEPLSGDDQDLLKEYRASLTPGSTAYVSVHFSAPEEEAVWSDLEASREIDEDIYGTADPHTPFVGTTGPVGSDGPYLPPSPYSSSTSIDTATPVETHPDDDSYPNPWDDPEVDTAAGEDLSYTTQESQITESLGQPLAVEVATPDGTMVRDLSGTKQQMTAMGTLGESHPPIASLSLDSQTLYVPATALHSIEDPTVEMTSESGSLTIPLLSTARIVDGPKKPLSQTLVDYQTFLPEAKYRAPKFALSDGFWESLRGTSAAGQPRRARPMQRKAIGRDGWLPFASTRATTLGPGASIFIGM